MQKGQGIKDVECVPCHRLGDDCPYCVLKDEGWNISKEKMAALQSAEECQAVLLHARKWGCIRNCSDVFLQQLSNGIEALRRTAGGGTTAKEEDRDKNLKALKQFSGQVLRSINRAPPKLLKDQINDIETRVKTILTVAQSSWTASEQSRNGRYTPTLPFSNDGLCFFALQLAAPRRCEVEYLLQKAHENDEFPYGSKVRDELLELYSHPAQEGDDATSNKWATPSTAFIDGGAACSSIRTSIAESLGCRILTVENKAAVKDHGGGTTHYNQVTYVQLNIPGISYRQIILCLVIDHLDAPILIGSMDKGHLQLVENVTTRTVTVGPPDNPVAILPFLDPDEREESIQPSKGSAKYGRDIHARSASLEGTIDEKGANGIEALFVACRRN